MANCLIGKRSQTGLHYLTWHQGRIYASVLLMFIILLASTRQLRAQENVQNVNMPVVLDYRIFDTSDADILNPKTIAYSPDADLFFLLQAVTQNQYELFAVTPYEHAIESILVDIATSVPIHMAFDEQSERLLILTTDELFEVPIGWNGALVPVTNPIHHKLSNWQIDDPLGIAVDSASGHLYILNGATQAVAEIAPDAEGNFSNAVLVRDISLDLPSGITPSGLTHNNATGHFYTVNASGETIFDLNASGELYQNYSLAAVGLTNPQSLVIAPTADNTDDPAALDLFVIASQPHIATTPAVASLSAPQSEDSIADEDKQRLFLPLIGDLGRGNASLEASSTRIFELFLTPRGMVMASATMVTATLVRTTDTSLYSPPSPDPSGVTYMSHTNTLMIGDGEVDEMPIFADKNLFETTLSGDLVDSYSSIAGGDSHPNDEPVGAAYAPPGFFFPNAHLFLSDDTSGSWITVIDLGADGKYGTADDSVPSSAHLLSARKIRKGLPMTVGTMPSLLLMV